MADNTSKKGFASPNYDQNTAEDARSKGGQKSSSQQDMSQLGRKGGKQAQKSGNAHELTSEERSRGGEHSSSKQDMSELGRKSGSM